MTSIATEDGECVVQLCNDIATLNILTGVGSNSSGTSGNSDPLDNCFVSDPESNDGVDVFCTACRHPSEASADRNSLAVGQCVTCSALLCRACVFAHKFMLCFQGHNVMPLVPTNPSNSSSPDNDTPTDTIAKPKPIDRFEQYFATDDSSSSQDSLATNQCQNHVMTNEPEDLTCRMNPFQQGQRTSLRKDDQSRGNSPLHSLLASLYLSGNDANGHGLPGHLCDSRSSPNKFMPRSIVAPPTFQQVPTRDCVSSTDLHSQSNLKSPVDKKAETHRQAIYPPVVHNESSTNELFEQGSSDILGTKNSFHTSNDLLIFLDKTAAALQAQHWRASLKIHEGFEYFRDEMCQRRQVLMKVLDDAFEKEQRRITELANEVRSGSSYSAQDVAAKLDVIRSCEQVTNQNAAVFEFVTDCAAIRQAVLDGCGQLRIRQLQDSGDNEKHVDQSMQWNSADSDLLSSGYLSAMSLSQTGNQISPFVYPNTSIQFPAPVYDSGKQPNQLRVTTSAGMLDCGNLGSLIPTFPPTSTNCSRADLLSHWSAQSSDGGCYWLQDPCWNSSTEPYSLFPGIANSFNQNPADLVRRLSNRISEPVETATSTISGVGKTASVLDPFPLAPGGPQSRYSDVAQSTATVALCDSSVSGCCCGNRPLSSVRRQKMVYHCKFGEFGGLDGQFTEPSGVAVNTQSDIIVADTNNHRIQVFNQDGNYKFRFGECGKRDGQLLYPNRVAVFKLSGDIVVTERSPTHQVQIFNQNGMFVRKFGSTVLQHPRGVCVDPSGNIIVVECKVMRVFVFDRFGNVVSRFNCSKHLEFPNSVCANDKQEIFISDNRAHCVRVFSYDGRLIRTLGGEGITNFPIGVGLDAASNVLVADNHNNFNLTLFSHTGQLLAALESKVKHAQCFDAAIMDSSGSVVLSSKDYHIYVYRYMPTAYFSTAGGMADMC